MLRAIVRFLNPRLSRAARRGAEREFLGFPVEEHAPPPARPVRQERARPADAALLARLAELHGRFNADHFAGTLSPIPTGTPTTRLPTTAISPSSAGAVSTWLVVAPTV